jgi:hypothetical protein
MLPPERRDGLLLMCHERATHGPVELLEIGETAVNANLVLQPAPEAFHGMQVVAASGWQKPHSIELRGRVVITHRKPPEVRICRLRNQSVVGTRPPSTSTPH